jgi:hypothetical protein
MGAKVNGGRTILCVEIIPYVREGYPLYAFLIEQPVFRCSRQLGAREACQRMEVDVIESRTERPRQGGSYDSEKGMPDRDSRLQGVEELRSSTT